MTTIAIPRVYSRSRAAVDSDIYISGEIRGPEHYIEEFQTLREANEGDEIKIFLNTPGGRVDTAVQYLSGIRNTKATVTCVIEGLCQSAGTYIFLAADQWIVNQDSLMMIHNYSGGAYGKGKELLENAKANDKWISGMMDTVYKGFLTVEEIEKVNSNQDIWLTTEEINDRLEDVIEVRTLMIKEHEELMRVKLDKQLQEYNKNATENSKDIQECPSE